METQVFGLRTGMKVLCWIVGIICIPLIVTIPFAVLMIMMAVRARVEIHEDKLVAVWVRTREVPWSEMSALEWGVQNAGGIMGVLMGKPLHYYNQQGKKVFWGIMVEAYENTPGILQAMEEKSGLSAS